ncbi:MAG: threonine/serine exporter family protein [Clostridium sp.]
MLIVGSIMPLLPGVAFVKGLRDLISGDLVSGMSRVSEAFLTAGAIAVGVGVVLDFWIKIGG